jgi:hypothetical protein
MDNFTLRSPADPDVIQIIDSMSPSDAPYLAMPSNQISLPWRDLTQFSQINAPVPDDSFEDHNDQTGFYPAFGSTAAENVDSRLVVITHNTDIISGILHDL